MSTPAFIAKELKNGDFKGIYCHWDGDTAINILKNHYTYEEKINKLLYLGFLSQLGKHINPLSGTEHLFSKPQKGVCVSYKRERGEANTEADFFISLIELKKFAKDMGCQYLYIFRNNEWESYCLKKGK
jgi:hypothetical protein